MFASGATGLGLMGMCSVAMTRSYRRSAGTSSTGLLFVASRPCGFDCKLSDGLMLARSMRTAQPILTMLDFLLFDFLGLRRVLKDSALHVCLQQSVTPQLMRVR